MKPALPEPGTPAWARLTTLLNITATVTAAVGLAIAVASLVLREPTVIAAGAAVVASGCAALICTRDMARTERTLATLNPPEDT